MDSRPDKTTTLPGESEAPRDPAQDAARPTVIAFFEPRAEDDDQDTGGHAEREGAPAGQPEPAAAGPESEHSRPELSNASIHGGRSVIGLDVGTRSLKIVHLQTIGSSLRLVGASATDLPPQSDPDRFAVVSQAVRQFVADARPRIRAACCALSGPGVATVCCSMPRMGEKDLAQALQWKIAEATSLEAGQGTTGYYTLGARGASGNVDVVAAGAPHEIGRMGDLFHGDHPRLSVVISEPLAAENVIMAAYHEQERGAAAVVDIGSAASKLSVTGQNGLEFTREIPVGGDTITAALCGRMSFENTTVEISRQAAETIKRQYTIGQTAAIEWSGAALPASRVLGAIRPVLERLTSEIVRSLQFYAQSHNLAKVDNLFLCGGGAALGGLAEYLAREARIPTTLLDPWRMLGLEVAPDVTANPALFVIATGTAIHDGSRINLLPPHIKARRVISAVRTGSLFATGCALFAFIALSWTASQQKGHMLETLRLKHEATVPMEKMAERIAVAQGYQTELSRRRQILNSLGVGRPVHAAILKELSNILPDGTYLRSLSFSDNKGARRMQLLVDIYTIPPASSIALKQQLVAALEDSPFFVNVSFAPARPSGPRTDKSEQRQPDEVLQLTCQVIGFPGE